jgi:hypothetical protein
LFIAVMSVGQGIVGEDMANPFRRKSKERTSESDLTRTGSQ